MTGWIAAMAIGAAAFLTLRLGGLPRAYGWLTAAALLLGATGYAAQQQAGLPGRPATPEAQRVEVDPGLVAFRTMILPGTDADRAALVAADAALRAGDTAGAAAGLLAAIERQPTHAALWTGLGGALAAHDAGQLSPSARLAFRRAVELAPNEPGPPFFVGMALAQSGDLPGAKAAWLRALQLAPRDAAWRVDIAERLVIIDQYQAMMAEAQPPR
jgi:cytochrome c-type biogenesis protein CcmH